MRTIKTGIFSAALLCCAAGFMWMSEASTQDTDFWTEAAESSLAEVALSNVALQKTQSEAVRQFAQQMVTDHTQANQDLAAAAQAKSVTVPTTVSEKRQRDVSKLNGLDAGKFDQEYMKMMVKDHERAVKLFERQAQRGTDTDAKALAARLLPTLQAHLTMARSLYDSVRGGAGNGTNNSSNGNSSNGNSSDVNRSANVRQDTNRKGDSNSNSNNNSNSNSNSNANSNANGNTNNDTNRTNTNRTNTNRGNSNNSNVMNSNHM